jgi:hypothetical protein
VSGLGDIVELYIYTVLCCFGAIGNRKELFRNVAAALKGWIIVY